MLLLMILIFQVKYYMFIMILSIIINIYHRKPNYKHAPTTLFLYITLILILASPLSVTAQYGGPHHSSGSGPSPILIGIMLAIIVAGIYIILNLLFIKTNVVGNQAQNGPPGKPIKGLDPSVVDSFPVFKFSDVAAHRAHSGPLECAVCISPFEPEEKLRVLPKCNHVLHVECLDPWLKEHSTCPLCRVDLVPETGELNRVESGRVDETGAEVNAEGDEDNNDVEVVVRGDVEEGHIVKYKRWKSTGHVAEFGGMEEESWTRYTLMLPEKELKNFREVKIIKFKRTKSSI